MGRTSRLLRSGVGLILSLGLIVGPMLEASANHGKDGSPISEVPDLFADGASYGTIKDHTDSTEPNGQRPQSGCNEFNEEEGGSAYRLQAKIGTRIQIDVTDDIAGTSLHCVGLYREHLQEDTLPALYGFPELEDYEVHSDDCSANSSVCRTKWVVPETDGYYLVFWPYCCGGPDSDENYATFRFSISIRKRTKTRLGIEGASKPEGSKCFTASAGSRVTGNVLVTKKATGIVKFRLQKRKNRAWKLVATKDFTLSDSKAGYERTLKGKGKYRLRAQYLGDDTRAPSKSRRICLKVP